MRLVTGFAGYAVRVLVRDHLREGFRPSCASGMAPHAEHRRIELGRRHGRISGMRCLWSVAGFAVDPFVLSFVFQFSLVGVTCLTGIVAREFGGMGRDLGHGRGAIVTVLAEGFRNHVSPNSPEN